MNFKLTEEHLLVRDAAREFATNELLPGVIERDNTQSFPIEIVRKMGELGFMGIMVDPKYGGSGMDTISYVLIMEELSKIDASASVMVSVNNSLVCYGLETYGTLMGLTSLFGMVRGEPHCYNHLKSLVTSVTLIF